MPVPNLSLKDGSKSAGSDSPDKTSMAKVAKVASGKVDEGKDTKPSMPNMDK